MLNSNRRPRIPSEQWTFHKTTIRHLYLDDDRALEGVGGVIDVMEKEHNFLASKSQYERKLKEWGCRKYLSGEEWETIAAIQGARKAEGKGSKVFVNGCQLKPEKIRKELRRARGKSLHRACEAREGRLPANIAIRSPSPTEMPSPQSMSLDIGFEDEPFNSDLLPQIDVELSTILTDTVSHSIVQAAPDPLLSSSDFEDLQFGNEDFNWDPSGSLLPPSHFADGRCTFDGPDWFPSSFLSRTDFYPFESVLGYVPTPLDHLYTDPGNQSTLLGQTMPGPNFSDTFSGFASLRFNDASLHDLDIRFGSLSLLERESTFRFPSTEILHFRQQLNLNDLTERTVMGTRSCHMLRNRSVDVKLTYHVASILINNDSPLDRLYDDSEPLNAVFRSGIQYIHSLSAGRLNSLLNSFPAHLSESMSYNLLGTAIELDSRQTVEALLGRDGMAINDMCCTVDGKHYTPIERCFILRHMNVAQVLLAHNADLSVKASKDDLLRLCLDYQDKLRTFSSTELDVFATLLDRGITPRLPSDIKFILGILDSRVTEVFVTHVKGQRAMWLVRNNLMTIALRNFDNEFATRVVELAVGGQDYRASMENNPDIATILSASLSNAAHQHNSASMDMLLAAGAEPTASCLANAVRNKNLRAVEKFLELGVDPNMTTSLTPPRHELYEDEFTTALAIAIQNCYSEALQLFSQRGTLRRIAKSADGAACALAAAITAGEEALISSIIQQTDFSSTNILLPFPLDAAIKRGDAELISRLIIAGIRPNASQVGKASALRDPHTMTIIMEAHSYYGLCGCIVDLILHSDVLSLKELSIAGLSLERQVTILNLPETHCKILQKFGINRCGTLAYAIACANQDVVDLFLQRGLPLNDISHDVSNIFQFWPLSAAVLRRRVDLVLELLASGAQPFDNLALLLAAEDSNVSTVNILLDAFRQRFGKRNQFYGTYALLVAIEKDDLRTFEALVEVVDIRHIATLATEDRDGVYLGISPLGKAIRTKGRNQLVMIQNLLNKGVDANSIVGGREERRETALLVAIGTGNLAIVEILVKERADVNIIERPRYGVSRTPLQRASELGNEELVRYLLKCGANPNEPCAMNGATALQLAARKGFRGIAEIFLGQADVNAEAAPFGGRTAFEGATENGKIDMMILLFRHGADLLANESRQYKRAVKFAKENNQHGAHTLAKLLYQEQLSRAARLA